MTELAILEQVDALRSAVVAGQQPDNTYSGQVVRAWLVAYPDEDPLYRLVMHAYLESVRASIAIPRQRVRGAVGRAA